MMTTGCGGGTTANGRMAPEITSTPPSTATVGVPFNYTVNAAGMTPMTFAVVSGPQELMVHPTSGIVTWTPQSEGLAAIEIRATNLAGSDTQAFEVDVRGSSGPVFITEPPTEATVAAEYAYDPDVVANGEVPIKSSWSMSRIRAAPLSLRRRPLTACIPERFFATTRPHRVRRPFNGRW
jgi:hypothetical protein